MSKKRKTSNIVLLILGIFIMAFIVSMEVIFCVTGSVPDTLIQYTLGAGGLEVLVMAAIKVSKVVSGEKGGIENE
jgi:predicted permease